MINYVAIIISFLTGGIVILSEILSHVKAHSKAIRGDKRNSERDKVLIKSLVLLLLFGASTISFQQQIKNDELEKQQTAKHERELTMTVKNFQKLLSENKLLQLNQIQAGDKLAHQLKESKQLLNYSIENLNRSEKAITAINRQNEELKNLKISFVTDDDIHQYKGSSNGKPQIFWKTRNPRIDLADLLFKIKHSEEGGAVLQDHFINPAIPGDKPKIRSGEYYIEENARFNIVSTSGIKDSTLTIFHRNNNKSIYDSICPPDLNLTIIVSKRKIELKAKDDLFNSFRLNFILPNEGMILKTYNFEGDQLFEKDLNHSIVQFTKRNIQRTFYKGVKKVFNDGTIKGIEDLNDSWLTIITDQQIGSTDRQYKISNLKLYYGDNSSQSVSVDNSFLKYRPIKDIWNSRMVIFYKFKKNAFKSLLR